MTGRKPFVIGLTGSIGMGKSTASAMFARAGAAVWDADAAVHRLYARGGDAVAPVAALCPQAVVDGALDRARLSAWLAADPANFGKLEAIVHPLVARDRAAFLASAPEGILVCDVPLLFETGQEGQFDLTCVVSAPAEVQRQRVLARPGMTAEKFATILARQMPDAEKRARAGLVIDSRTIEAAQAGVDEAMARARKAIGDA
jgi:dephospho-CoA kinase